MKEIKQSKALLAAIEQSAAISKENGDRIEKISDELVSTTFLLSAKSQKRLAKGQVFSGFVLEQKSADENEFIQFLDILKKNITKFPTEARFQLAIRTHYIDEEEGKLIKKEGDKIPEKISHWTAVDIWIDNGKIKSFVLDAANARGFQGICINLKKYFPRGDHYAFREDSISNPKNPTQQKYRAIQSDDINCRNFSVEHLRQLSQIGSSQLYAELKESSTVEGDIFPKNLREGLSLNRIFRATQSWVTLNSLPSICGTLFKGEKTVGESAEEESKLGEDGTKRNNAINRKASKYFDKACQYFESVRDHMKIFILEHRTGFSFLENPILFKIHQSIAAVSAEVFKEFLDIFSVRLKSCLSGESSDIDAINQFLDTISDISQWDDLPAAKNEFLLATAYIFSHLDVNDGEEMKNKLQTVISQSLEGFHVRKVIPVEDSIRLSSNPFSLHEADAKSEVGSQPELQPYSLTSG